MYISSFIYCILPFDCILIVLGAHMLSHHGFGPGTKDQGPKATGSRAWGPAAFEPRSQANIHDG